MRPDVQGQMAAVAAVNMVRMQQMAQSMALAQQTAASAVSAAAAVVAMAKHRSQHQQLPAKSAVLSPHMPDTPMDMTRRPFNKHGVWTPSRDGLTDTELFLQAAAKRGITVRPAPVPATMD